MENENMTFTVSNDHGEFGGQMELAITISRDSTLTDVLQVFERMALALTYQPGSLINAYRDRVAELEEVAILAGRTAKAARNAY